MHVCCPAAVVTDPAVQLRQLTEAESGYCPAGHGAYDTWKELALLADPAALACAQKMRERCPQRTSHHTTNVFSAVCACVRYSTVVKVQHSTVQ